MKLIIGFNKFIIAFIPFLGGVLVAGDATLGQESTTLFERVFGGIVVSDGGESVGCAWGDANNDGHLDLFVPNFSGNNFFYVNDKTGGFEKSEQSPLTTTNGRWSSAAWADIDNDGDLDLFVTSRGNLNQLYENNGNGGFEFMQNSGLSSSGGDATGCSWADFNNDGWVDLYVSYINQRDRFYQNDGHGRFMLRSDLLPINTRNGSLGCAWSDYDKDGHIDLFVSKFRSSGANELYRNRGDGSFEKIEDPPFSVDISQSNSCAWGDYNNDGWPDLFVGGLEPDAVERYLLYRNLGGGAFEKVEEALPDFTSAESNGATWGDVDNDGWLDLFIANWNGTGGAKRNLLYLNEGLEGFRQLRGEAISEDLFPSDGCAMGDYDNDGFLDVFVSNLAGEDNNVYRNAGNANHWLQIRCVGTQSNWAGIGAKITIYENQDGQSVIGQYREITGGDGFGSTGGLIAQFGLRDRAQADRVEIVWPSGIRQELNNIAVDQRITVVEGFPFSIHPNPRFAAPNGGFITNSLQVSLIHLTGFSSNYRFTLDGSNPSVDSLPYSGPFTLTNSVTLKFREFIDGQPISSMVMTEFRKAFGVDDHIPVAWKIQYFGELYFLNPEVEPGRDPDGDGFTNHEEYVAETNPSDAASNPLRLNIKAVPKLSWLSSPGRIYQLQRKPRLYPLDNSWETVHEVVGGEEGILDFIDEDVDGNYFYRVVVVGD